MTYWSPLGPGSGLVPPLAPHDSGPAARGMFVNRRLPWIRGSRGIVTLVADRCAVLVFHLQVAALSLKPGASLITCHLSDRTACQRAQAEPRAGWGGVGRGGVESLAAPSKQARQEKINIRKGWFGSFSCNCPVLKTFEHFLSPIPFET